MKIARFRFRLSFVCCAVLTAAFCQGGLAQAGAQAGAQGVAPRRMEPTADQKAHSDWRAGLMQIKATSKLCREAVYPATTWKEVPCLRSKADTAKVPVPLARASRLLHPLDEKATRNITALSSGSIVSAEGTLPYLENLGVVGGQPAGYSLQMNTNGFKSPLCQASHNAGGCVGWEQFYVESNGNYFIQTWLGNYLDATTTTCPTNAVWTTYFPSKTSPNGSCYRNSVSGQFTPVPVTTLAGATVTAESDASGNDTFTATIGDQILQAPPTAGLIGLAGRWNDVDFNVFGQINSQEAFFPLGTVVSVFVTVNDGTGNAPACTGGERAGGFGTLEATNLTLGNCASFPKIGSLQPGITFYESVPPSLNFVQATSGSADGGETVTVQGCGLSNNVVVKFGNAYTPGRVSCTVGAPCAGTGTGSQVSCLVTTPPGSGTVPVTASNLTPVGGEGGYSSSVVAPKYTYKPVPTGRITPASGPPGTTVTLTGTNLSTVPGGTQVVFTVRGAPIAAGDVSCSSTTQCTFFAPGFADLGNVAVGSTVLVTVNGETGVAGPFTFYIPPYKGPPVSCAVCRANGQTCKTVNGKNVCVGLAQ